MRGIFERSYFANNGPLVQALDVALADALGVPFSVAVSNDMMAMMLGAKAAFRASGTVIAPPYLTEAFVQALIWGGYRLRMIDVDPVSWQLSPSAVARGAGEDLAGIVGVHLLGDLGPAPAIEEAARAVGAPLLFDASDAFGDVKGRRAGAFGDASILSLGEEKLLNAAEGGSVATGSLEIANRVRTLRNFHPGQTFASMPLRMNGKMAEAPAMLALAALSEYHAWIGLNRQRYELYARALAGSERFRLVSPSNETNSFQRIVVELGGSVDSAQWVAERLDAYGIDARPAIPPVDPTQFPVAAELHRRLLELPNGADLDGDDIERIATRLKEIASG